MALSPNMKRAVRRLANILGAYARKQGWWPLDFRLYYQTNEEWGKIRFVFVSDGFEGRNYDESYRSVMDYVGERLQDDPELIGALGLTLQSFKQLSEGGLYSIDQSYSAVKPKDLVRRAILHVAMLIVKFAKDHGWNEGDCRLLYRIDPESPDRVRIFLALGENELSIHENRRRIEDYVRSRLFDEPDLLSTFTIEIGVVEDLDKSDIKSMVDFGLRSYFAISRLA